MMKNVFTKFLFLFIFTLISCQEKQPHSDNKNTEFEYIITGEVKGGDGLEIALILPNKDVEDRMKAKIENGTFTFSGKTDKFQYAEIQFEQDIITNNTVLALIPIIIESGETKISLEISDSPIYFKNISNVKILGGEQNKFYYDLVYSNPNTLFGHFTYIDNYEAKKDSMHTYVYPKQKADFFKKYDSIYDPKKTSAFSSILNLYLSVDLPPLDPNYMSESDKIAFKKIIDNIDSTSIGTTDYQNLKYAIHRKINAEKPVTFIDFTLNDKNKKGQTLSEIIAKNNYTVLDFWWSGCSPCRVFNREGDDATYKALKDQGIEIVGINVDKDTRAWKKASTKDNIPWMDLYAGAGSDVQSAYKAYYMPSKIIFDSEFNIIDFEFSKAQELLELVDK